MRRTTVLSLCLIAFTGATVLGQEDPSAILRKKAEGRLATILGGLKGVAGIAALDLTSGERFGLNEQMVFPQGSAIKIPVLMEVYRQAAAGRIDLRDHLWVTKKRTVGGSGILQFFGDSTSALSVRDLCMLMITQSDNTATNMLIDLVGMENVNATLANAGMKSTRLQRRMMDMNASARADENLSTPSEALRIMEMLHAGNFVDPRTSREILDMLRLPKGGSFKGGVPDSVSVAFKPGGIAGVSTEWAIVLLPERPFAVVFMESQQIGDEADGAMKEAARLLFEYFWRKAHATRYGTYVQSPSK
jgi:beta-lactamase class A